MSVKGQYMTWQLSVPQDPDMVWDFITLRPETTHQVCFMYSDRGTPDGYRHMNGYGSHTFKLVNKDNQAVYCKFHFKVIELSDSFLFIRIYFIFLSCYYLSQQLIIFLCIDNLILHIMCVFCFILLYP